MKKKKQSKTQPNLETLIYSTKMKVIGIGGGGSSIVSEISSKLKPLPYPGKKVSFVVANTDLQALKNVPKNIKRFQFGQGLTQGLGTGMNPEKGKLAAEDAKEKFKKELEGVDFCILIACLGGGTGSGAGPVFARAAKSSNVITLGIFTLPFRFEGGKRAQIAKESLEKIKPNVNALVVIPNERIFQIIDKKTSLTDSLSTVNKILLQGLEGLIEIIYRPNLINIDFADFRTIFEGRGKLAYLNSVEAQGANRVEEVIKKVLQNPLTEYNIGGAQALLYNIVGGKEMKMKEVEQISKVISEFSRQGKIIFGISQDKSYNNKIRITLVAVGCGKKKRKKTKKKPKEIPLKIEKQKVEAKMTQNLPKPDKSDKSNEASKPEKPAKLDKQDKSEAGIPLKVSKKPKKIKRQTKKIKEKEKEFPLFQNQKKEKEIKKSLQFQKDRNRKNALDLKKEAEQTEKELLKQEKKWEIPAFLRKK